VTPAEFREWAKRAGRAVWDWAATHQAISIPVAAFVAGVIVGVIWAS